jgi:SSS family solute:Na+ symporter
MIVFGLHILDILVLVLYMAAILWIGGIVSKKQRGVEEFFLAGRGIGKVYQFFLNFGEAINADNAVGVTREVYRQGVGGMWINFIVLFVTPFHWFVTMLFRRVRLLTVGDFLRNASKADFSPEDMPYMSFSTPSCGSRWSTW